MEIYENNRKLSDFGKPSPAVIPSNPDKPLSERVDAKAAKQHAVLAGPPQS